VIFFCDETNCLVNTEGLEAVVVHFMKSLFEKEGSYFEVELRNGFLRKEIGPCG